MSQKEIYLAGGCFWGMQAYFENIPGIQYAVPGYANGNIANPTYEMVCHKDTGFAETIHVVYESNTVCLTFLLKMYFDVIDPTAYHRQGNDIGSQYRTGIYYKDAKDKLLITEALSELQKAYDKQIVVECLPLQNFYQAEEYHQQYLKKNPNGYCHIPTRKIEAAKSAKQIRKSCTYEKSSPAFLKATLDELQYAVTQENKTEPAFQNEYWNHFEQGIYVDITTGEPLFTSSDKFESSCGWPSFTKPVAPRTVKEVKDISYGMHRTEIRSRIGDSHLGHVFTDGPLEQGGLRYCINSASLRFIPYNKMKEEGYEEYMALLNH